MAFNFPLKNKSSELENFQDNSTADSEFSKAVNLFNSQKVQYGISLEELSKKTKISRNVLIAIENGKNKYLPEKTYLISMIKRLETELNLEIGSLNGLLSKQIPRERTTRFNFINIDFFDSWIGSLLYFIIMILSILALNSQQQYLLQINSLSTEPIPVEDTNIKNGSEDHNPKTN